MDGLVVLGRAGRPLVVSRFRNEHSAYPLLHVDYLNSALQMARAEGNERDVPPVLVVPVAEDVLRADGAHALSDDDASSTSDSLASDLSSDEPSDEDAPDNDARNVWDEPAAPGANGAAPAPPAPAEAAAAPPEGGAVLCHIRAGELRLLCPVSRQGTPHPLTPQSTPSCRSVSCTASPTCCRPTLWARTTTHPNSPRTSFWSTLTPYTSSSRRCSTRTAMCS